jgi:hypothetical protein
MTGEAVRSEDEFHWAPCRLAILAEAKQEHGLSNFMADRRDAHHTHSWTLRMQLVPEPNEPAEALTAQGTG